MDSTSRTKTAVGIYTPVSYTHLDVYKRQYAFLARGTDDALMVFRVKDEYTDKVASLLVKNGMKTVDQEDLTKM